MINWKSILSTFDDKPTLLQWLKLVEKALQESVLETVTVNDTGNNTISFTFTFADGTSLTTPTTHIDTVKGEKGDKGDKGDTGVSITGVDEVSDEIVGGQTLTTLRIHFSNGTNNEVVVYAENGKAELFKHTIEFTKRNIKFSLITTRETSFTDFETLYNYIASRGYFYGCGEYKEESNKYLIFYVSASSQIIFVTYSHTQGNSNLRNTDIFTDTVVQL